MRLNTRAFALTCGILWGLAIFVATVWLKAFGFEGQLIRTLDHFYFGYSFSFVGAIIGAVWGFVDGLVCGFVFAWLYNKLSGE